MKTIKTTIEIDAQLYQQIKSRALEENQTIKELISKSLSKTLREPNQATKKIIIGGHNLGGISSNLSRTEIYADF